MSSIEDNTSPPHSQQRAFSQLSSYRGRSGNSVSPTRSSITQYQNKRPRSGSSTRSIEQSTNGVSSALHYPIVTQPSSQRKNKAIKGETLSKTLKRKAKEFLGLDDDQAGDQEIVWSGRRIRMATRRYGGVNVAAVAKTLPRQILPIPDPDVDSPDGASSSATFPRLKPSVVKYMTDGLSTLGRKMVNLPTKPVNSTLSRSYRPSRTRSKDQDHQESDTEVDKEVFFEPSVTDALQGPEDVELRPVSDRLKPDQIGMGRIGGLGLSSRDEPDKREFGIGVVGEVFGRDYKTSLRNKPFILAQMNDIDDYRPYFTYWVTTVQIIIMIITLILYGFGPIGIELAQSHGEVLTRGLYIEEIDFNEPASFWFGPRAADLIHLGAKFSPCMRKDESILNAVALQAAKETETGCCIRNDHSGCVQVQKEECSSLLSTFHKWTPSNPGPDGRTSGPVCGQDPQYCKSPKSSYTATWQDDISMWPICHKSSAPHHTHFYGLSTKRASPAVPKHMTCETVGRPCCIGIHGKCEIRTKEFCDFTNGHFHPEATLCSQVSCMEDVCGMLPFIHRHVPDQFYRLWTSLFLHAGLLHLTISVLLQLYLMRDMEKLCGPTRMSMIYLGSGMAGNLASAIFVPYKAESGPAGAQFGLLAMLIVEVLNVWPILTSPWIALGKLLAIVFVLFLLGTMPWIDNYAHIMGFITGFLLSYAVMPYIKFTRTERSKTRRTVLIVLCLTTTLLIFIVLFLVFYYTPIYDCSWCKYLTCIPFTQDFCADQNINFKKDPPIINF